MRGVGGSREGRFVFRPQVPRPISTAALTDAICFTMLHCSYPCPGTVPGPSPKPNFGGPATPDLGDCCVSESYRTVVLNLAGRKWMSWAREFARHLVQRGSSPARFQPEQDPILLRLCAIDWGADAERAMLITNSGISHGHRTVHAPSAWHPGQYASYSRTFEHDSWSRDQNRPRRGMDFNRQSRHTSEVPT